MDDEDRPIEVQNKLADYDKAVRDENLARARADAIADNLKREHGLTNDDLLEGRR